MDNLPNYDAWKTKTPDDDPPKLCYQCGDVIEDSETDDICGDCEKIYQVEYAVSKIKELSAVDALYLDALIDDEKIRNWVINYHEMHDDFPTVRDFLVTVILRDLTRG